jgi:hypothetical protein
MDAIAASWKVNQARDLDQVAMVWRKLGHSPRSILAYRQEQIYAQRHQIQLPRQTLARWVALAADWLQPIYEQIRTGVMAGGYVQVDETPIDYLEPGYGRTKQGYLWTGSRPGSDVFFHWATSRAAALPHFRHKIKNHTQNVCSTESFRLRAWTNES